MITYMYMHYSATNLLKYDSTHVYEEKNLCTMRFKMESIVLILIV